MSLPERATDCPLCHRAGRERLRVRGIAVLDCPACGHRFAAYRAPADHVAREYGDAYFTAGGAGYPDYLAERGPLLARGEWYRRRLAPFARGGRLLDVGSAAGFFALPFQRAGWQVQGIEPNARMARHAREVLGVPTFTGELSAWPGKGPFDLVSLVQVLPHFPDPAAALARVAALLRSGGLCLIETWHCESRLARCLGRRWHEYSPPTVLHWFTPQRLDALLAVYGLARVAGGRPRRRLSLRHAATALAHALGDGAALRAAARRVPAWLTLPYPGDDLFWALYRRR